MGWRGYRSTTHGGRFSTETGVERTLLLRSKHPFPPSLLPTIRSTFVSWSQALKDPERLLGDLSRFTRINTLELGLFHSTSGGGGGSIPAGEGQTAIISSAKRFKDPRIQAVPKSDLTRVREFISLARSRGFHVACNFSPLYIPSRRKMSMSCVDIRGAALDPPLSPPQPYAEPVSVYGCPNNPEVVRFGQAMMREIVEAWAPADIICINHAEFPMWPGRDSKGGFRLDDLFSCFCSSCEAAAKRHKIDFGALRREVEWLYKAVTTKREHHPSGMPSDVTANDLLNLLASKPSLAEWLHFRSASMTAYVRGLAKAGRDAATERNPKLLIGLEFQIPSLSKLLGTDYSELSSDFDFLVPKFPDYLVGNTVPIVAGEISSKTGAADLPHIARAIMGLLGLGHGPKEYRRYVRPRNMLYSGWMETATVDRQLQLLPAATGKVPIYPYLWLENGNARELRKKIRTLNARGIDGYFLWQWEPDLERTALRRREGTY